MITIYLDHNIIDNFDRGDTAYIAPILANKECQPIVSIVSIDEIFRGGDSSRSKANIDALKGLRVKYIHDGQDQWHMSIDELDYENMYQKWLKMQADVAAFKNSLFSMISSAFSGGTEAEVLESVRKASSDKMRWIRDNFDRFPGLQEQMQRFNKNPEEDEWLVGLISLRKLLPFAAKEINNTGAGTVFWECVDRLRNASNEALITLGEGIKSAIEKAKDICDQMFIVLIWLNFFGYHSDDLKEIARTRSFFSDAEHGTYGIVCDGILTLDKRFAKKLEAAISALQLKTRVARDANTLLALIGGKAGR